MRDAMEVLAHLDEHIAYDPSTGEFTRRTAVRHLRVGDPAGHMHHSGYIYIGIKGHSHSAQRLAWLIVHRAWPAGVVDHMNGVKTDNRIANLRDVSVRANNENSISPRKDNELGVAGVRRRTSGRFQARLSVEGRLLVIGSFDTATEASAAYIAAKAAHHTGFIQPRTGCPEQPPPSSHLLGRPKLPSRPPEATN